MRLALSIALVALTLAACDGEDPVDAALRDAAAARHAAAVKETGVAEGPAQPAPAVECAAPTDKPSCGGAPGETVSAEERAWVEATLHDHRKALAEAEALLAGSDNPAVRGAAEQVIAARKREIAQLEALRRPEAGPAE